MPMYLFATSFGPEGFEGHLEEGGVARRGYIDGVLRSLGGSLVGFWYAYGDVDLYVIGELPGNNAATAFSMHVSSSGRVRARTVVLVTPEEFDEARAIPVDFRPPGEDD
ncbi:MAG: GYD domain-containing protein [Actinomycetota bacterium]